MAAIVRVLLIAVPVGAALAGCRAPDGDQSGAVPETAERPGATSSVQPSAVDTATPRAPAPRPALRLEVSLSDRRLYVYEDDRQVESHPVAIGRPEYPTPTGEYAISQVVWNPEWIPPDSPWAEDEERKAPGEEGNPLGRAQLVFEVPYSIHGTEDLASLGKAESHGSIRVSNEVAIRLGRRVMEAGGAPRPEGWVDEVLANPTEKRVVNLPHPVPLTIRE